MPRPKYPHMSPYEVKLWDEFLWQFQDQYDRFEYDIHVGFGDDMTHVKEPTFAELGSFLTQKRIDAVGFTPSNITIFEVKPDAGLSALGQLIGYPPLYRRTLRPTLPIKTAIVTDFLNQDDRYLFDYFSITSFAFPIVARRWEIAHRSRPSLVTATPPAP